ncbi:uncharacterized protein LOC125845735 [Solanum stenotomum]|uniref:uncharacterized protein LOC125845735 n=1 Tax=Solanum stenotomum TaxID=172797 RepID=UPI0020D06011|nr:uncharacterized protein LOC125845735 [Solanum stenotomum]
MHCFIGGLGDYLIGSCTVAALNSDMDFARLMAQSLDRSTASAPAQSSRPRQEQTQTPRAPNLYYQRGASRGLPPRPTCRHCGRSHLGECRYGSTACYGCGIEGHKIHDCLKLRVEGRSDRPQYTGSAGASSASTPSSSRGPQPPAGRGTCRGRGFGSGAGPNRMYALAGRQNSEASPDVVIGVTLSYVTPFVAKKFGVEPELLHEPFAVSTPEILRANLVMSP